jgi:hypothetical protein
MTVAFVIKAPKSGLCLNKGCFRIVLQRKNAVSKFQTQWSEDFQVYLNRISSLEKLHQSVITESAGKLNQEVRNVCLNSKVYEIASDVSRNPSAN